MPTEILGLPTSDKFASNNDRFFSHRREILHSYPNGGATLTGILGMLTEESVDDSQHYWYEKQYYSPSVLTRGTNPATSTAPTTGDSDTGTAISTGTKTITTDIYIKVNKTGDLKRGHILRNVINDAQFAVLSVVRGVADETLLGYIVVRPLREFSVTTVATEFGAGTKLDVVGTAYIEGASGINYNPTSVKRPYPVMNTTQIWSDVFDFSGSVLQMGMKWDKTGAYKEKAHDTAVDHMTSLERSLIWGKRSNTSVASFDPNQASGNRRTMSGILEFLELWDKGSTGLSIDGATYAPYAHKAASTTDSDDGKRIITNADGLLSYKRFMQYAERVGRYNTNRSKEKLVLIGNGALIALTEMFRKNTSMKVEAGFKVYGLDVTQLITPFGTFNFVSHPLFNEDVGNMNKWMLFLDIWSLRWRPLRNRDTRLKRNMQNNGDDFRRDGYLTEATLEFHNPQNHMLWKNVGTYVEE